MDYFLEREVYSDDPFTDEIEPAVPFSLGVMIKNIGFGTAGDVTITSSQPTIIENENGETIGMVSVLSDVTKQRELDRMKNQFLSSVSHEIRTPIVAIRNSVSVMLSEAAGPLTEAQEKFLNIWNF